MKIDTHGMKMRGLKAAAGPTKDLTGYYSGLYDELFYDRATGEMWTIRQTSLGQKTWTEYHDGNVIKIGNLDKRMSMQEIADMIAERVSCDDYEAKCVYE